MKALLCIKLKYVPDDSFNVAVSAKAAGNIYSGTINIISSLPVGVTVESDSVDKSGKAASSLLAGVLSMKVIRPGVVVDGFSN